MDIQQLKKEYDKLRRKLLENYVTKAQVYSITCDKVFIVIVIFINFK